MVAYRLVATYGAAPTRWTTNITDLTLALVDGRVILTVTTQPGGGLSSFAISDPGQPLQLVDNLPYLSGLTYRATPRTSVLALEGGTQLYQLGLGGAEPFASPLDGSGDLGGFARLFNPAQIGTRLTDLGHFSTPSGDFIYSARIGEAAISVRKLLGDGQLGNVSTLRLNSTLVPEGASLDRIIAVDLGSQKILVAISGLGNFISTHLVGADGSLGAGALHGGAIGTGFNTPTAVEAVRTAGATFLVMAAQGSSSLSVFQLQADGRLIARDHVIDELTTRFQSVTALATAEIDGRAFVFAGGRDGGISVFTLQPDGRLLHLTTIADSHDMTLAHVTAIEARAMDGRIALFVASGTEPGITQLVFDPGAIGFTGIAAAGSPTGTDGNDLMMSRPGTIWMGGGPGDDILIATSESIALLGGPGADVFVAANFKGRIAIRDYEVGIDRLDLSQLGMVRSTWQLRFVPQSYGVKIFYGEAVIDIFSKDGRTLGPADFGNDLFAITHYNLPPLDPAKIAPSDTPSTIGRYHFGGTGHDVIQGGQGSDFISGGPGNDRIFGFAGHDTINGDQGNDMLRGHAGNDSLSGGPGRDTLFGDQGNDTLRGGAGPDLLYGGPGDDLLMGEEGNDTLYGGAGHDTLIGGRGNDTLHGQAGNDLLQDMQGNNVLIGGGGHDTLIAGPGNDKLHGGAGRDSLVGGNGNDLLEGGAGNDRLFGGGGRDTLLGGGGNDYMDGGPGNDRMLGGAGNDRMFGGQGNDSLWGGAGNDRLNGGPGDDLLYGEAGNDWLAGGPGNDRLWGGAGNDTLQGGAGNDLLDGGGGNDRLLGGMGNDTLRGGPGDDLLQGGGGNDLLQGGKGNDTLRGGAGSDTLQGGAGRDLLEGGAGKDTLRGGAGNDRLLGGGGDDLLYGDGGDDTLLGGAGNDRLFGGAGRDLLRGGAGRDTMTGGAGRDVFAWGAASESRPAAPDLVTDFQPGADRLDLSALDLVFIGRAGFSGPAQLRWDIVGQRTHILIDLNGDGQADMLIHLTGRLQLDADDFLL